MKQSRMDKEFEALQMGAMSHADFRALFEAKLQDMEECEGLDMPTEQTLYRAYLNKIHGELRAVTLSKDWKLDGKDKPARRAVTWKDVAKAVSMHLEEKADITATGAKAGDFLLSIAPASASQGLTMLANSSASPTNPYDAQDLQLSHQAQPQTQGVNPQSQPQQLPPTWAQQPRKGEAGLPESVQQYPGAV